MWFRDKFQKMAEEQPVDQGKFAFVTKGLNKLRRLLAKKSKVGPTPEEAAILAQAAQVLRTEY